ncbi:hypothetical protein OAK17_05040 [Alphaproteobacteria bacterium]|nr:hypothetical protein [Alphaproteobacteria bacterium]
MLQKLILLIILLLPILGFFLWIFIFNKTKKINSFFGFPLNILIGTTSVIFVIFLFFIAIIDGEDINSKYIPPYVKDGKVISGKFE